MQSEARSHKSQELRGRGVVVDDVVDDVEVDVPVEVVVEDVVQGAM